MVVVAVFVAKLLDPVAAVLALIAGWFSRAWWQIAVAALVIAALMEMLLAATQITRQFSLAIYLVGIAATAVWAALAFFVRRRWFSRGK